MKVLKFGGTSVGSVESIMSLKKIVESQGEQLIVVVSALGGITDKLIATSRLAASGDKAYRMEFEAMVKRHHDMIDTIIDDSEKRSSLTRVIDNLFEELRSIYYGVYLIRDLSEKIQAAIVSYGERLSSHIVATLIDGAQRYNSRDFIKTLHKHGKNILDSELTVQLVKETFRNQTKTAWCRALSVPTVTPAR